MEDVPLRLLERAPWYPRLLAAAVRLPPWEDQQVGCLWWCGAQSTGGRRTHERKATYGSLYLGSGEGGRVVRAHVAVATAAGVLEDYRVPPGMNLDHRCRRSLCVEHTHLELVTVGENQRRRWEVDPRPLTEDEEERIRLRGGVGWGRLPWWWPESRRRT